MTYRKLIQAGLWGKSAQWPEEETEALLRLNAQQGTGPLVYPVVLEQPSLSSYARVQMRSVCMYTIQQQVKINYTLEKAWTALLNAGIRPVLMKGAGLAALYPDVSRRSYGDVDLYVGPEQYHPACAVMRETFPDALKFDEELDHYKHYNLIADGISIEVHRVTVSFQHPLDERRYAKIEAYGVAHACDLELNGLKLKIFEPTFNAFFVMLHAWEHMMTKGANVRQLCDIALLLHHDHGQIDPKRLKHYLTSLHLMDVWQLFMYILVHHLGLPKEESFFYTDRVAQRAERLIKDMLDGRLREPEKSDNAPKNRLARKLFTMRERLHNARRMGQYSPAYARHMVATVVVHGAGRLFAKDRHWE